MAERPFDAGVRRRPELVVIDLHGDIDIEADQAMRSAYAEAVRPDNAATGAPDDAAAGARPRPVLLNFEDVGYVNSTGIALIVGLLARARAEHRPITACGLSEHYRQIFAITRLADFMPIFPDEETAAQHEAPVQAAPAADRSSRRQP
jgi:anti-sigma B factor antagonist